MTLDRRLQILIDEDRFSRLESEAKRRKVSVAEVVREAIDARLAARDARRRLAARRILESPKSPAIELDELKALIDQARSGGK